MPPNYSFRFEYTCQNDFIILAICKIYSMTNQSSTDQMTKRLWVTNGTIPVQMLTKLFGAVWWPWQIHHYIYAHQHKLLPWACLFNYPDSKVHGANMGSTWVLSAPDGPHVGPMNLAIRACTKGWYIIKISIYLYYFIINSTMGHKINPSLTKSQQSYHYIHKM